MAKRITALLLSLCMLLLAVPISVGAATEQAVSLTSSTVYQGNTASVTLKAENFSGVASFEVYVYYDPAVMTLSGTTNGSMLSSAQSSVNSAQSGTVKLVAMSLNGISGTGTLLTLRFTVAASCPVGAYPITVATGNAYDTNLSATTITGVSGKVTVQQQTVTTPTFSISGSLGKSSVQKGDSLTYRISGSTSRPFASADFTLNYDYEHFDFDSVELAAALDHENALYSVNTATKGQVFVSYISKTSVSASTLLTLKLTAIADIDGNSTLSAKATNVYKEDLTAYLPGTCSNTVTLKKLPEVIDYPDVFFNTDPLYVGQQSSATFCIEQGPAVAAADFEITYDPTIMQCVSVEKAENAPGMVVINDKFKEGTIKFSYVNMDGDGLAEVPLITVVWQPLICPKDHYQVTAKGFSVVDADQNPITLEYVTDTGCIYDYQSLTPTCTTPGGTGYLCSCAQGQWIEQIPALGHDLTYYEKKDPTCTAGGWTAYETCSRCDHTTYEALAALGHELVTVEAQDPTCTDEGWPEHQACTRCDYKTASYVAALGHRLDGESRGVYTITNDSTYPFSYENGVYTSINKGHSTTAIVTISVEKSCILQFNYGVSSEQNFDKLIIAVNGVAKSTISGLVSDQALKLSVKAGDKVTVRYQKDGSVSKNDDKGWFSMVMDASTVTATCTESVLCDYCSAVVAPATGHSYTDGLCALCGRQIFALVIENGKQTEYTDLQQAVSACKDGYVQLTSNCSTFIALSADLYIDLNGYNLSGTIAANGYKVYGMDSATDGYTCDSIGYFNCVDENGNAVVPEHHFKGNLTGSVKRYMAIEDEKGYSFHRFYLAVTHMNIRPTVTGVGYKAVFYGDAMVAAELDAENAFGFTLSLEGGKSVTGSKARAEFASGKELSLRVEHFDVERFGENDLSVSVWLKLQDGTVISTDVYAASMRDMLEQISANYSALTREQLTLLKTMIEANPIMKTWSVDNLK